MRSAVSLAILSVFAYAAFAAPTPADMIDAIYKPGQNPQGSNPAPIKMDVSGEPWAKMDAKDFLSCFDKYGQFRWREWPGKTKTDDNLRRAAAIKRYVGSALVRPLVVGVHWHQYSDQATSGRFDGEHFQVGLTDVCDRPYHETVDALRTVGYTMYETRTNKRIPHR